MTIEQIENRNHQFQDMALGLSELIPRSDLLEYSTLLTRSANQLHKAFLGLLASKNMDGLWKALEKTEEIMDDLVYELDRLHDVNCVMKIKAMDDFLKKGYDLLSIYSMSSDQVVKQKVSRQKSL